MRQIVVGGHTRNIGKTTLVAGLIRELEPLGWTAVKITQYGHGICSLDGEPCGCAPREHAFVLTEELDAAGASDTSRLLAAGARRSLWLRVREGQLAPALPLLRKALARDEWVIFESNSIMEFVEPDLYIAVLDPSRSDFKDSSRKFLDRVDAFVAAESRAGRMAWPDAAWRPRAGVPQFFLPRAGTLTPEICRFVRSKLDLPEAGVVSGLRAPLAEKRSSRVRTE
ncbi:MAG: hypothetical protein DMG21_06720 [Acidobacteria bacterium]|nr:MAG: hypothetical protein DMG21_06720 [Acidobacteriota bacterium]